MNRFFKFITLLILSLSIPMFANAQPIKTLTEKPAPVQLTDRLQKIKSTGILNVLSPNIIPYSYQDAFTGKLKGIDVDILTEVAKRLGVKKIEPTYISFPNIIQELTRNPSIDLIAQGMYITDERKQFVNFTMPIYTEMDGILTTKTSNIKSKADLKDKTIGVIGSTLYESLAQKWKDQGLIRDYIKFFDNTSLQTALENNVIDAMLADSMTEVSIILQKPNSNFRILSPSQYKSEINLVAGYALKKEDSTLLAAINEKLQEMKIDGTLYEILAKNGLSCFYIP
ncbi:substrate-binding periplasmic protein [Inconstantimicrobium mannanitabidum]|uniref:Glutamine ABC transporter substrate-binding protein n=1 Tax=Inconstantimicrobium mannanitabidum TaxID=1604901 RepID=A0ACB5RGP4_9CLOT|nr:transporter substrate-binding domain-containing protein [Clostridium sp. TW13]GKX68183.1 glutamine ABC transporter substrate-binding protein [Clostridium sp. TW13]